MVKLVDAGEEQLVHRIVSRLISRNWPCKNLKPDDDAACIPGLPLVFKIDGYSIKSMRFPWMSLSDVGWKATIASMSDVVAKAAKPVATAISIGVDPQRELEEAFSIVEGSYEASLSHGALLVAGDTNSARTSDCEWIDVAVVGIAEVEPIGLSPGVGDVVYTTYGRYGVTIAALSAAKRGEKPPTRIIVETSRPMLRVKFVELASRVRKCLTSSKDVSDGLAYTLLALARHANASIILDSLPPLDGIVEKYIESMGINIVDAVFNGGEEYEIVFTVKQDCIEAVESTANSIGLPIARIGVVTEGPPKIYYHGKEVSVKRWDQFKGYVAVANG